MSSMSGFVAEILQINETLLTEIVFNNQSNSAVMLEMRCVQNQESVRANGWMLIIE